MKAKAFKRLLSLVMALSMLIALAVPASAIENSTENSISFEKVDNSTVSASLPDREVVDETDEADTYYADTDVVRVSIVLEDPSTIEAGYSTTDIASNRSAMAYRNRLETKQTSVTNSIERTTGDDLDVVWNLTLAANIISANVEYGQIEDILATPGVADVLIENSYAPAVVSVDPTADPNMATSSSMIGSTNAYLEGYTGAGTRIAVIDTGIDDDHQSFDGGAYEYALSVLAEKAGVDYDEYVAGLNLLTADEVASVADLLNVSIDAEKTYLSAKVPYAYNYVDEDYDISHDNDTETEHGSHVTGIAAANSYIPDGEGGYVSALESVQTQGVAPEAQVLTMKVFGKGGGAYDSDYMAAIEDAILLGADAINLSLGSANPGYSSDSNAYYQGIMDELSVTDTVVSISAGNAYGWPDYSYNFVGYVSGYGYLYSDGVSMDTVGSPGSYTNSLSVASADNTGTTGAYLTVDGQTVFYNETTGYANEPMTTIAGEQNYILIDGVGTEDEFAAIADVLEGAIAVCSRGTTSFFEKGNAAASNGAIATIIYNNTAGTISMDLTGYLYPAPCVSITQADGDLLRAAATPVTDGEGNVLYYEGTMTVSSDIGSVSNPDADVVMSDFSSWGVPGSLELKPEITAPGGNIYSVNGLVPGGTSYELMSGTSMAAPQVAGMAALLAQYIRENGLAEQTGLSIRTLAQSLLMSTAEPLREADSGYEYYSVLKQGAGLANVGEAVKATSYILMGADATDSYADGKVKAELGDDPARTGEYTFSFTINNLSGEEEIYALSADLFTQDLFAWYVDEYYNVDNYLDTWTAGLAYGVTWTVDGKTLEASDELTGLDFNGDGLVNVADGQALLDLATGARDSIYHEDLADLNEDGAVNSYDAYLFFKAASTGYAVVPADGSVEVTVTLTLTDEQKEILDSYYTTGAYIEGYVYATAVTSEEGELGTSHSIPVLGYYGNWTDPSMYDIVSWTEYYGGTDTRWTYLGDYYSNYVTIKYAGDSNAYPFGGNPIFFEEYDENRNAINSESGDVLSSAVFSLIRNAKAGKLNVTNTTSGEVELEQEFGEIEGAFYYVNAGAWYYTSSSASLNFVPAGDEGDTYELSLTTVPEYYVNEDGSVEWDALGDGATLSIPFTVDNTAPEVTGITGANIHSDGEALKVTVQDNQYIAAVALFSGDGTEYIAAFPGEQAEAGEAQTITLDSAEYGLDDGVYLLQVYDYAMNCSTYRVFLNTEETDEVTGITLSADSLTIMKGNTAALTATVLPVNVSDAGVTWSSSDESIATVNANGIVTGVEKGECTITATSNLDPMVSASCAVTVKTAEVTIYGALQDEDGNPLLFTWDMEHDSTWTAYAELDNNISSIAWDWLDDNMPLYQQNASGYMYQVDVDTGETLDQSAGANLFGAPIADMDFAFYTYFASGSPVVTGVYGNYFLFSDDPLENTFNSGYTWSNYFSKYTGASKFVALSWGGTLSYNGAVYDVMCALDDAGYMWYLYINSSTGDLELLGYDETDLDLSFPTYGGSQYCSMVWDDNMENVYLSYFTGSTNEIYQLAYDEEAEIYVSTLIGDVGSGVWPTALFMASPNETADYSADRAAVPAADNVIAAAARAEAISVEPQSIDLSVPTGGLNSIDPAASDGETELPALEDEDTVVVNVTEDVDSTNGVSVVTYDPEVLTLVNVSINGNYTSQVVNEEDGSVTIGYVSLNGIAAGSTVATLEFVSAQTCASDATEVTILHQEVGSETPNNAEVVTVEAPEHTYGEPEFSWSEDNSSCVATFTCEVCGDVQTVECAVTSETTPATADTDGAIVYTAAVTFNGVAYAENKVVVIPATGSGDTGNTGDNGGTGDSNTGDNGGTGDSNTGDNGSGTSTGTSDSAATGDSAPYILLTVVCVLALAGCAFAILQLRKRRG